MGMDIQDFAVFCKRKGFVYASSEIYGGFAGFWDYGPLGVELFNKLKAHWWKFFVQDRPDMVGIDASIISHPSVWKASGHLSGFGDVVLRCSKCKHQLRGDHFIEEQLGMSVEGLPSKELDALVTKNKLVCPKCKGDFEALKEFNLLFGTSVGADRSSMSTAYLRGETAQGMFTNFKLVAETARQKLPFGIAQIGTCFRNEIAPRDFLFRAREFTIAEFEFFIHPEETSCSLLTKGDLSMKVPLLDSASQKGGGQQVKPTTVGKMIAAKQLGAWHGFWLSKQLQWLLSLGISSKHLRIREHTKAELSHYSSATFDVDYAFPFGIKEIAGNANRGQYDVTQHVEESKQKLAIFDEASRKNVIPWVIEPTFGMGRVFLALLVDAYTEDKKRGNVVLKLDPQLAPYQVGVFPLVNKLEKDAYKLFDELKTSFSCFFDKSGSIGRRYARADEIGIPYGVTFDFDSLKDKKVTIRDRDSTKQVRVALKDLQARLSGLLA